MPRKKRKGLTKRQAIADVEKLEKTAKKLVLELEKVKKDLKMSAFPGPQYSNCPKFSNCPPTR